jgi:hypothetical protein
MELLLTSSGLHLTSSDRRRSFYDLYHSPSDPYIKALDQRLDTVRLNPSNSYILENTFIAACVSVVSMVPTATDIVVCATFVVLELSLSPSSCHEKWSL